jgi:NADPH-dependent 2,4-dienoyl-CoA reductase/sulfur reductase-like enzyme/rhodanese-related sulfurtransferase
MRIVVIGANAAGAKAASKAKRMNPEAEVIVLDRGSFISYGACGIPYFISDEVKDVRELMRTPVGVLRDPPFFKKVKGVDVLTRTEVLRIDRGARTLHLREAGSGALSMLAYDSLILATGSSPLVPPLANRELDGVLTVKTIEAALALKERTAEGKAACVIGGGLIGLETAEALHSRGMDVTVVEMRDQILPGILDEEMAKPLANHLRDQGVEVVTSCRVLGFEGDGRLGRVITEKGAFEAELAVMALGAVPNVSLAKEAGLTIGSTGAVAVDDRMRTSDPDIYACGDCCESTHVVTGKKVYVPLGSTANKQGRVAGINAAGGDATFAGVLGTTIIRVFDYNAGKTGLTERDARALGIDAVTVLSAAPDRAHFFPAAKSIGLKLVSERTTRRLLGVQAVGPGDVAKRVDTAAAAITFRATAEQLAQLDLAYAPPFASAMDNLIVAGDILRNKLDGDARGISPSEVREKMLGGEELLLLDVRTPEEHREARLPGAKLIPLGALRERLAELPRDREIVSFCKLSLRGYEAQRILDAAGFERVRFMDGGLAMWPYDLERGPPAGR